MQKKQSHSEPDDDLIEEIDDEEMYELIQEARKKLNEKTEQEKENPKKTRAFPKWMFWLIAVVMVFQAFALIPQTFSIPAFEFIKTSAVLSANEQIKEYKKAVVVIETEQSRGTGFSISDEGIILTNSHVVKEENKVTVAFSEQGLYEADVVANYPEIDLAVLETGGEDLPKLSLASELTFTEQERVKFIGNPLRFKGIANEGEIIDYTTLKGWDEKVVMIEAPVYRGNSGSPVFNQNGEVIGIIFATQDRKDIGRVGLFIPIDYYYQYHQFE